MMWRNGILHILISGIWRTTSALRLEPALPFTVIVNQPQIFTWIRTDDDDDVPVDLQAIPINGSPTQSLEDNNDDFTDPRTAGETNDLNDEDGKPRNGSVTVNFPSAMSFSIVAVKGPFGPKPFHTFNGTVVATASPGTTTNASTTTQVQSASSGSSNTALSTLGSSSSVSSTVNGSVQTGTPTSTADANSNTNPTLVPAPTFAPPMNSSAVSATPNTGAIAGGVVGGVLVMLAVAAAVFYILKRRKIKLKHNLDPTPYLDTIPVSGSDAPYTDIRERKMQMVRQRESLERELEVYEQASQESNSRAGDILDGPINGGYQEGGIVQVLRRMEVLTQRIATLEAGMAPPDYSSRTS
ncbi:hypothetical protein E1B28_013078 [Marasmius oreades]|uniref:receptor protein-tyrosine kinase n=1 Tax=Marasmius oreades TaxID=181124 RepID=A0A9P7RPI1_9AGAR|nr:uncharacterized protein E1B28_013078 [Marasmius oreades]KAG7087097.1 hypothetical protein E1B28_013078 [Marasmius oreades]